MVLRLLNSKIVAVEGLDATRVASSLGGTPQGNTDLLLEAQAVAQARRVAENDALAVVKRMIAEAYQQWVLDPQRELELVDGTPDPAQGPTISMTHTIVELVISQHDSHLVDAILPDIDVLLRRHERFLELYSPLRLSEEADLIVAKITGQRTAREICTRSPHGSQDVVRLIAALVATGMLESVPVASAGEEMQLIPNDVPDLEIQRKPLPLVWILAAAFAIVIVLGTAAIIVSRNVGPPAVQPTGNWGLVVDMGCELDDLKRVLEHRRDHPKAVRAVKVTIGDEECWRLVWGSFATSEAATDAIPDIPAFLRQDGFDPHPIELSESDEMPPED